MKVENNQIILKPVIHQPREGWEMAFRQMKENGEDQLILPENTLSEEFGWEW